MKNAANTDSKQRFSNRVDDYTRYRPGYPPEALQFIRDQSNLNTNSTVADIGAGTGIFTALLLNSGASVIAVEPNEAMRSAADRHLQSYQNYSSVAGSAEQTGLADQSVDLITAAQAFHWFDFAEAKKEFVRVLKPAGKSVLIWNRRDSSSAFMQHYDALLKDRLPEYNKVNHTNATDERIGEFLGNKMRKVEFPSDQSFDLNGLKGRLMSSSYCPAPGTEGHDELMIEIEKLYSKYSTDTGVQFDYSTQVYIS